VDFLLPLSPESVQFAALKALVNTPFGVPFCSRFPVKDNYSLGEINKGRVLVIAPYKGKWEGNKLDREFKVSFDFNLRISTGKF